LIAKVSRRVAGGSVGRLVAYVSNVKKIGDLRDWKRTSDYILDRQGTGARVDAIRVTNCSNDEPGLALAEIAATQGQNTSSKTDKTYHLIVSFPPGEKPSPAQLHDIEDTLCAAIGLADHQRISAVHNDTDHFHFHVAINKVHPKTLKAITPFFDQPRLQAACIDLEKKHGLTPTNHTPSAQRAGHQSGRGDAIEVHGGQQSLLQWIRDEAGPALLQAQEEGQGWQDIHRVAAKYNLEIKPRGAGLVISATNDQNARVKPSDIDRRLTLGALSNQWGPYQAPTEPKQPPEHAYPRAPIQTPSPKTADLFRDYQRDRERLLAARKTHMADSKAASASHRAKWTEWSLDRRASIKTVPYTATGRRSAYAAVKRSRDIANDTERERQARARKDAISPLPTWQSWLLNQAAQGNTEAAAVLRSTERRQSELGAAILSAANVDDARHVIYQHLRPTVGRDGSVTYRVADGGRVTDQAKQIRVDEVSISASFLALTLAADRFGDRALIVTGTDAFKSQLAQLAALNGVNVRFTDPAMETERQRHTAARSAGEKPQPGPPLNDQVTAFIAGRNAVRDKVTNILPHRAWTAADAGDAKHAGRRQIAPGLEVTLLERAGETLVKQVSPAQAAKASTWRIGDIIRTDNTGRFHDHRPQTPEQPDQDRGR
jgi:hypothetical protein